jgi:hypothetical protein
MDGSIAVGRAPVQPRTRLMAATPHVTYPHPTSHVGAVPDLRLAT